MTVKFNWKQALVITIDVVVAGYLLMAMMSFNKPMTHHDVCTQVKIDIGENVAQGFLNVDEIKQMLQRQQLYPLAQKMDAIDVRAIEESLCRSPYITEAQCYKTHDGHVCISLSQRMPVIRVKADNGDDYFVDSQGGIMEHAKYRGDLIIATGPITRQFAKQTLTRIGNHIVSNRFWKHQIVQINVLADGSVEIVPRVGDHVVYLGLPVHVDKKLERLKLFYRYGLSKAGWNKYSYINLEFDNQIICKKRKVKQ